MRQSTTPKKLLDYERHDPSASQHLANEPIGRRVTVKQKVGDLPRQLC